MTAMETPVPTHIQVANRFFVFVLSALLVFSALLAPWHGTWSLVILVGLPAAALPILSILVAPAAIKTRMLVAASTMSFCALNIHQSHGFDELHFGIFVLIALLVIYQDWMIIATAAAVIAVHHFVFNQLQADHYQVFVFRQASLTMVFVHAAYVLVESAAICYLAIWLTRKAAEASGSRARLEESFVSMRSVIDQAKLGIEGMTAASGELAMSSRAIADGALDQASSLELTTASLQKITATVRQSADMASRAKLLAVSSEEAAEQAGRVVSEAIVAMGEINAASTRISDIISTINEIAFQTNLLAVNAAVEAARAGEEGRGFGVVASEVRSLAQRTSQASKEIKRLIEDSLSKLQAGTRLVDRSGQSLANITHAVSDMGKMVTQIAAASAAQSIGVDQANQAIAQIDRVTQTNSAETAKLAEASQSLSQQSGGLMVLVKAFHVNGGRDDVARPQRLRG